MFGIGEDWAEGMEGGGGMAKWWGEAGFGCMRSTFSRFFRDGVLEFSRVICYSIGEEAPFRYIGIAGPGYTMLYGQSQSRDGGDTNVQGIKGNVCYEGEFGVVPDGHFCVFCSRSRWRCVAGSGVNGEYGRLV